MLIGIIVILYSKITTKKKQIKTKNNENLKKTKVKMIPKHTPTPYRPIPREIYFLL